MTKPKMNSAGYDISKFTRVKMPKDKQKRVRKPRTLKVKYCGTPYLMIDQGCVMICGYRWSLKPLKQLHNWLGRAIAYLEEKEK